MIESSKPPVQMVPDLVSFWRVYDDALPLVYGYLARRADCSTAEDLTQEVFTTAARALAVGDGAKVSVPWLMTVARSRLVDHYRAEGRRVRNLRSVGSKRMPAHEVSAEDAAYAGRLAPTTEAALGELPGDQRAALMLHHVDDLSVADVAVILCRSVRATESLLARARHRLRAAMQEPQT